MTVLQIIALIAENDQLKAVVNQSTGLLKAATVTIVSLKQEVADLNYANGELQEQVETLEEEVSELNVTIEFLTADEEDECACGQGEHVNDTNANEDFLKELALVLANDESLDVEDIPQLLTDIVTSIKVNTAR